jgi:hypothetical protein
MLLRLRDPAAGRDRGLIRFAKPMAAASCTRREDFSLVTVKGVEEVGER